MRVEHFSREDESTARNILARLEVGEAGDSELLMQGAQLCSELFGQHLFTHLTALPYRNAPHPSATHRAVASLGALQQVPQRGERPGWECVITYNFDDLGEAFKEQRLPYARWALTTGGAGIDPDELAQKSSWHIPVFHLHGYTPRRPFLITDTRFVFSTAQYRAIYRDRKDGLIDHVLNKYLANPVHVALYIGCSFIDQEMNGLLRQAARQYPGRWHYAILKWPENRHGQPPDAGEIEAKSQKYVDFGVQPIWVDDYSEIPAIIASLK